MKKVPVLITWDIDPAVPDQICEAVNKALILLDELNIKSTFFFTAAYAERDVLMKVVHQGHQVGLHGLKHDDVEEFNKLSISEQRKIIGEADGILREFAGEITTFRAPRLKISPATLEVLEKLGYKADSSVCPQRLDFVSSNLINLGWLFAPRKPYHPAQNSPFKRGALKLLELPISAVILPFISTTMRLFGLVFMKALFSLLYAESLLTAKPIVYLIHPTEFVEQKKEFKISDVIPSKRWLVHGVPFRFVFASKMGQAFYRKNSKLFKFMKSKRNAVFMTMDQYRCTLEMEGVE